MGSLRLERGLICDAASGDPLRLERGLICDAASGDTGY
jgi:hypothetical protein